MLVLTSIWLIPVVPHLIFLLVWQWLLRISSLSSLCACIDPSNKLRSSLLIIVWVAIRMESLTIYVVCSFISLLLRFLNFVIIYTLIHLVRIKISIEYFFKFVFFINLFKFWLESVCIIFKVFLEFFILFLLFFKPLFLLFWSKLLWVKLNIRIFNCINQKGCVISYIKFIFILKINKSSTFILWKYIDRTLAKICILRFCLLTLVFSETIVLLIDLIKLIFLLVYSIQVILKFFFFFFFNLVYQIESSVNGWITIEFCFDFFWWRWFVVILEFQIWKTKADLFFAFFKVTIGAIMLFLPITSILSCCCIKSDYLFTRSIFWNLIYIWLSLVHF